MKILALFSNQKMVIKVNNSCQKQCFMEIALLNVKTYIQKLSYTFYCNLIYKLKLIKQNVIFCSFLDRLNNVHGELLYYRRRWRSR